MTIGLIWNRKKCIQFLKIDTETKWGIIKFSRIIEWDFNFKNSIFFVIGDVLYCMLSVSALIYFKFPLNTPFTVEANGFGQYLSDIIVNEVLSGVLRITSSLHNLKIYLFRWGKLSKILSTQNPIPHLNSKNSKLNSANSISLSHKFH